MNGRFKEGSFVHTAYNKLIRKSWAPTAARPSEISKSFLVPKIVNNRNRLPADVCKNRLQENMSEMAFVRLIFVCLQREGPDDL